LLPAYSSPTSLNACTSADQLHLCDSHVHNIHVQVVLIRWYTACMAGKVSWDAVGLACIITVLCFALCVHACCAQSQLWLRGAIVKPIMGGRIIAYHKVLDISAVPWDLGDVSAAARAQAGTAQQAQQHGAAASSAAAAAAPPPLTPPGQTLYQPQHDILVVEVQKEESLRQPAKKVRLHIPHCIVTAMGSMAHRSSSISTPRNAAPGAGSAGSGSPSSAAATNKWPAVLKYVINGRYVPTDKELATVRTDTRKGGSNVSVPQQPCTCAACHLQHMQESLLQELLIKQHLTMHAWFWCRTVSFMIAMNASH
jgi:hypothetical protein